MTFKDETDILFFTKTKGVSFPTPSVIGRFNLHKLGYPGPTLVDEDLPKPVRATYFTWLMIALVRPPLLRIGALLALMGLHSLWLAFIVFPSTEEHAYGVSASLASTGSADIILS